MSKSKQIWRYKLHPDIITDLSYFSKLHQHNERAEFKEAWKEWLKDNEQKIEKENQRLTDLGFDGDLIQKMYVSARYYLKKKRDGKQEPKKRKPYVPLSAEFIEFQDEFILKMEGKKPADGFKEFMESNKENAIVINEKNELQETYNYTEKEILDKFKKTFKNRYFIYNK
tara:strand:- start:1330 stop:1839 length:510 start_codon:yes stop_codon:yes gene_type:complete